MKMEKYLEKIKHSIEPLRQEIINHKVYSLINGVEDLRVFMQYHVFAVWDFMSLLKSLQNNLTCTTVPWFPKGSANTRYLINEIVVGEESDVDSFGARKSHFELYLEAMNQCGADTSGIEKFIAELKRTNDLNAALAIAQVAPEIAEFVNYTFDIINTNKDYLQAAVFTYGREDLIPNMFLSMINEMGKKEAENISVFKYYLERHIEVDGDHHSHLALQMTSSLCGTNTQYWEEAEKAIKESLQRRIGLWDEVYKQIILNRKEVIV
jgi:hypothetical protein